MNIEMFAVLVDAIVLAVATADNIQHVLVIVLIGIVLGVGTWWALSILAASFLKNLIL